MFSVSTTVCSQTNLTANTRKHTNTYAYVNVRTPIYECTCTGSISVTVCHRISVFFSGHDNFELFNTTTKDEQVKKKEEKKSSGKSFKKIGRVKQEKK